MEKIDDMLDDDKLNKAINKGKRRSNLKATIICIIVFVIGLILNSIVSIKMGNSNRKFLEGYCKTTIPSGYISKCVNVSGVLGGISHYTICKNIGWRPVILSNEISYFGINIFKISTFQSGSGGHSAGEWPVSYWENGYKKLMFFHPDIKYKEYKKDFSELDKISNSKIVEMGLSFDKKYEPNEVRRLIPKVNVSWVWLDTYTKEEMDKLKKEAKEYDARSTYISEQRTLGIRTEGNVVLTEIYKDSYSGLLNVLKTQGDKEVYRQLKERKDPPDIIGVTVYGTPNELKVLSENPHIKGATIGVMMDKN